MLYLYRGNYWLILSKLNIDEEVAYNLPPNREIPIISFEGKQPTSIKIYNLKFKHELGKGIIKKHGEFTDLIYVEFPQNKKMIFVPVKKGELSGWGILNDEQKELLSQIYGPNLIEDDYSLLLKALKLTPDDFKWYSLDSNKELEAKLLLYDIKMALPNNSYSIYSFQTGRIRGFQRGKIGDRDILLHIFDGKNKKGNSYEILLIGNYSQEEIDIMLHTMEFKGIVNPPINRDKGLTTSPRPSIAAILAFYKSQ